MRITNKDEVLAEHAKDIASHFKIAGLLIAANVAALGYCINALNSYGTAPTRGVGILIFFFGVGLIAGVINMGATYFIRMVVRNAIRDDRDPNDEVSRDFLAKTGFYSLIISGAAFVIGLIVFIFRYIFY